MEELLSLLENAPAGPVELDTVLLYSPRSTCSPSSESHSPKRNSEGYTTHDASEQLGPPAFASAAPRSGPDGYHRTAHRLAQLRAEAAAQEMAECTFAPRTGRGPAGPRAPPHLRVEERLLLTAGQRRLEAARRVQKEREEAEQAECTFAPRLAASADHLLPDSYRPIHERINQEWRKKEAVLAEARAKADAEVTFKPKISAVSARLAEMRRFRVKDGDSGAIKPSVRAVHVPEEPAFKPAINPVSERMLEVSTCVPSDFHRRQRYYDHLRAENLAVIRDEAETAGTGGAHASTPQTGSRAAAVLALSDRRFHQLVERPEERWERMALVESNRREGRREAMKKQVMGAEATFAPQLNPQSLRLAEARKGSGADAALEERMRAQRAAERRAEATARELRECTFFPDTSKPRVIGYYDEYHPPTPNAALSVALAGASDDGLGGLLARIDEHQKQKEQWAAAVRAKEQERQLAECTFAPDTRKPPVAVPDGPVPVAGLDRFLEVKAMAEKRQAELQARAAKVFLLNPRSPAQRGPTVPRPFKLSSGERGARRAQRRDST